QELIDDAALFTALGLLDAAAEAAGLALALATALAAAAALAGAALADAVADAWPAMVCPQAASANGARPASHRNRRRLSLSF
ncbi:MAG TPA: hypothetical protein VIR57_24825, partial [Chloroflexota bacterium]